MDIGPSAYPEESGRGNRMLPWRTTVLDKLEASDRAALDRQRMVGLVNLLLLLLAGPMMAFGIGFFVLLRDPWLGAEALAGVGEFLAFLLNRRGYATPARLLGCTLASLVYFNLLVAFGANCGGELGSIPMIAFPPLLVMSSERRLLLVLYVIFGVVLLA